VLRGVLEDAESGTGGGELPHTGEAAACSACQEGYYKDNSNMCQKCDTSCATYSGSGASACTSCSGSKYLKSDGTCANTCESKFYADPQSNKCIACSASEGGITDCDTCTYDAALQGPKCLTCTSSGGTKLLKTELDGAVTCVEEAQCTAGSTHFKTDDNPRCLPCSDTSGAANDQGVVGCKTCTKNSGSPPTCTACLDGYYDSGNGAVTCTACTGENCAACAKDTKDQCSTCKPGYFLKTSGTPGQCFACDDTNNQGVKGCAQCNGGATPTCTKCKPNYRQEGSDSVTCTRACEDETACGGTAGSCDAIVVGGDGSMKHYCSQCRQQ
ncbi:Inv, partial [Giardia duodenalis]